MVFKKMLFAIFSWEALLIILGGLITVSLALKSHYDSISNEKKLAISEKEAKEFRSKLEAKQEEYITLQNISQAKSDTIIELQKEINSSSQKIIDEQQKVFSNITGGNSFPIAYFVNRGGNSFSLLVGNGGQFRLTDINLDVIDVNKTCKLIRGHPSGLPPALSAKKYTLSHINPTDLEDLGIYDVEDISLPTTSIAVTFTAPNGRFSENIFLRKKADQWLSAIYISKIPERKELYLYIQDGFLNDGENTKTLFKQQ